MLEKTCFQRGFEFFENIYKEKSAASKIKSSAENLASMIYENFILVLPSYSYYGEKKQNTDLFQTTFFKEHKNMAVNES